MAGTSTRLNGAQRVVAGAALGVLLLLASGAARAAYAWLTYEAGPNDRAAHGMLPASLQVNLIGALLIGPVLAGALAFFVAFCFVLRGRRWALYGATALALPLTAWLGVSLVRRDAPHWQDIATVTSAVALLACSVADLGRFQLERYVRGSVARVLLPVLLLEAPVLSVVAWSWARAAEVEAERARAQRVEKEAAEKRRADEETAREAQFRARHAEQEEARAHPAWNEYPSRIIDVEQDEYSRQVVTVHEDGTVNEWTGPLGARPGMQLGETAPSLQARHGPLPGVRHAFYSSWFGVVTQSGPALVHRAPGEARTLAHCASARESPLAIPLRHDWVAVGGTSACVTTVQQASPPLALRAPGCRRVTGLHAARGRLLVECPGRAALFDLETLKLEASVVTPSFEPGSARYARGGVLGVVRRSSAYAVVHQSLDAKRPARQFEVVSAGSAPQVELGSLGSVIVAGDGVCLYAGAGELSSCPLPRGLTVKKLALPGHLTSPPEESQDLLRDANGVGTIALALLDHGQLETVVLP